MLSHDKLSILCLFAKWTRKSELLMQDKRRSFKYHNISVEAAYEEMQISLSLNESPDLFKKRIQDINNNMVVIDTIENDHNHDLSHLNSVKEYMEEILKN